MSDLDNIPDVLKQRDQWLYWNASKQTSKKPLASPAAHTGASYSDPDEWQTFEEVSEGYKNVAEAGVGYVTAVENDDYPEGMIAIIDLDGVIDEQGQGEFPEWVPPLDIFYENDAYVEESPSGTGLHIPVLCRDNPEWFSDKSFPGTDRHEGIEFLTNSFCRFTGHKTQKSGDEVIRFSDSIEEWLKDAYENITAEIAEITGEPVGVSNPDELTPEGLDDSTVDEPDYSTDTDGAQSALFDIETRDVVVKEGGDTSGKFSSFFHGSGTGTNTELHDGFLHCWRHDVCHNALMALVVLSDYSGGCQSVGAPHEDSGAGPSCMKNEEGEHIWEAWKYAKRSGYIPKDDRVPYSALIHLCEDRNLCKPTEIPAGSRDGTIPADAYNEALEIVEQETGYCGRKKTHEIDDKANPGETDDEATPGETDDEATPGETDDNTDTSGLQTTSQLSAKPGTGYGRYKTVNGEEKFNPVTNFLLDVRSFMFKDGDRYLEMEVIPQTGEPSYEAKVPATVFNDLRKFKNNVVTGLTTTFQGPGHDLDELRKLVGAADAPFSTGTHHMGLHTDPDPLEFVTPNGVITADGWAEEPETVHINRDVEAEKSWSISPTSHNEVDTDEVAKILELLPQARNIKRILPVIGWCFTAPFRPHIMDWTGQFNTLHITGGTGVGKSATLEIMWQLLGMNEDPMSCSDSKFVLTTTLGSTNSIPMWFDEYRPGDMQTWELDQFHNLLRKATRGSVEGRGNKTMSTDGYRLKAPMMVSGEQAIQGAAEERRTIPVRFLENVKEEGSKTKEAFTKLAGGSYKKDGELQKEEGYDLHKHAYAFHKFVLAQDKEDLKTRWDNCEKKAYQWLDKHEINGVTDMPMQGLQTILFGLKVYFDFADKMGANPPVSPPQIEKAFLYIATQFGKQGNRKSDLDRLLEFASRAASEGYLEAGSHFDVVNHGASNEEIAIKLSRTFDSLSKYSRDYALDDAMLNHVKDYRARIKEAEGKSKSYIISASQVTTGLNRCVRVDPKVAADKLEFDPEAFCATPVDDDTEESEADPEEPDSNHSDTAIASLSTGRDVSFTAEIVNVSDGEYSRVAQGEFEGPVGSRLGWVIPGGNRNPFSARQGQTARISKATLRTDQDGLKQVVVNDATEVEIEQPTAGSQSSIDPTGEATTDGGEPAEPESDTEEPPQADRIHMIREIVTALDDLDENKRGAPLEDVKDELAQNGIDRSNAEGEIDKLRAKGEVYEPCSGHVRCT